MSGRARTGARVISPRRVITTAGRYARFGLTAVGFWLAVTLQFVYVPLLASGLEGPAVGKAFGLLVAVHVGTLTLGHWHRRG